jgi:RimJ/RimL family protein N-acetyltransferase
MAVNRYHLERRLRTIRYNAKSPELAGNRPLDHYLFSGDGLDASRLPGLPAGFTSLVWLPSNLTIWPEAKNGLKPRFDFLLRFVLFHAGAYATSECGTVCIFKDDVLVHCTSFTPRCWRFPYLRDGDLQIGGSWTHPAYHGHGLFQSALRRILDFKQQEGRKFWYILDPVDFEAMRAMQKARFVLSGRVRSGRPWPIQLRENPMEVPGSFRADKPEAVLRLATPK